MQDTIEHLIAMARETEDRAWPDRSADVTRLLGQYLRIWSAATAPSDRLRIARDIFSADGVYKDPMTDVLDPAGLVDHVETVILPLLGDLTLRPVGTPRLHGRVLLFSWEYVSTDGRRGDFPGAAGTDFAAISDGGTLDQVTGFFDVTLAPSQNDDQRVVV